MRGERSGLRAPVGSMLRVDGSKHLAALATGSLLAIAVLGWLDGRFGGHTDGTWPSVRALLLDVGLALSTTLLVAALVGVLIDRSARARLAEKLAEGWLWGLLGQDAPPQIQQRAKETLASRVVLNLDRIEIGLEWAEREDRRVLRVEAESLQMGTNYGPEPFAVQPSTFLVPSVEGFESRVTGWEFEVYPHDAATSADLIRLTEDELYARSGGTVLRSVAAGDLDIPERLQARRGDTFRLLRAARLFLGPADCFPLTSRRPSTESTLVLRGPALKDLDVQVSSSKGTLDIASEAPDRLTFSGGPCLANEWMWICWTSKPEDPAPQVSGASRAAD